MRAHLHGGPHDGQVVAVDAAHDELTMIDPNRVTIDTFHPVDDGAVHYRFRSFRPGSRARVADYVVVDA